MWRIYDIFKLGSLTLLGKAVSENWCFHPFSLVTHLSFILKLFSWWESVFLFFQFLFFICLYVFIKLTFFHWFSEPYVNINRSKQKQSTPNHQGALQCPHKNIHNSLYTQNTARHSRALFIVVETVGQPSEWYIECKIKKFKKGRVVQYSSPVEISLCKKDCNGFQSLQNLSDF